MCCVIIYLKKGVKISKDELKDAFDYNDDGGGIAWVKNEKVYYSKGYKTFKEFYNENVNIIDDDSIERVIHFRITSRGETSAAQCHPFLLSDNKDDMALLNYEGKTTVLFMNGTIFNQKLISGLNDTASYIINNLYDNGYDFKMIDKDTGAKWAIVESTGVSLFGDFEEDNGVYYSNLYHRWNYWSNLGNNYSNDSLFYDCYGFDDIYDKDDDKDGWGNEEFYGDWLEEEYSEDAAWVYFDSLYYDGLTPNQALNIALEYILEHGLAESDKSFEYTISGDDVFEKHYTVEELLEDEDDLELLELSNISSLADLFPPKEDKCVDVCDESFKKDYLNGVHSHLDSLVDNFSDLVGNIKEYLD